tara:strand:- start:4856 stop:5326 length:471 start_codon:yes stop_codon:yes gene_type:complete
MSIKQDFNASSSNLGSIYREYNIEETQRYNNFFYGTLFEDTIRTNVHREIFQIVKKKLVDLQMSNRVKHIMERIQNTNNIVLQHAFLFFALSTIKEVKDYVYTKYQSPEKQQKILKYIDKYIKEQTEKLLIGGFKSLSEYTDTNRENIILELGLHY